GESELPRVLSSRTRAPLPVTYKATVVNRAMRRPPHRLVGILAGSGFGAGAHARLIHPSRPTVSRSYSNYPVPDITADRPKGVVVYCRDSGTYSRSGSGSSGSCLMISFCESGGSIIPRGRHPDE